MSLFKRLITHATRHELSRFDELYLRHAGQECYLFGDGVTLKWMDLHQFADRPSILSSMGIYHREVDALRALYCVNTEPYWFWPYIRAKERGGDRLRYLRQTAQQEYRRSISQHLDILFLVNISNYVFIRSPNVRFVTRWYQPRFEDRNLFKDRFDSHDGTLRFQLALAIFLGFERAVSCRPLLTPTARGSAVRTKIRMAYFDSTTPIFRQGATTSMREGRGCSTGRGISP